MCAAHHHFFLTSFIQGADFSRMQPWTCQLADGNVLQEVQFLLCILYVSERSLTHHI
jgi:hypothetical protein